MLGSSIHAPDTGFVVIPPSAQYTLTNMGICVINEVDTENKSALPGHWEWTKLGDVVTKIIGGGTPSKNKPQYWEGDIPWLTVKDMRTRRPADAIDHISEKAVEESSTNIIPEDTVIIATRIGLGKVIRVPYKAAINQDLKALVVPPEIDKGYLEYWFVSKTQYLESIGSGTTVKGIRLEQLRGLDFPLAPPEQQKRIVAKIEELFSHIDAGIEALKNAKQLLKQYRQSVLKAAVTGELTKEWREANKGKLEPASQLLERILKERRQKWEEQQLEQFKAKGKKPKDDKWKEKYKEPFSIDDNESMWLTMKVGDIFDCIVPNRDKPKSFSGDIAWVTTPVINEETASIDYEECELGLTEEEVDKYNARLVPENSVIMTCVGRFGITAVAEKRCVINQQLHCFLPSVYYSPKLLAYFLQEKEKFMESIATATTVQYMNKTNCNSIPIPVMSRLEQLEILEQVERRLSGIERLAKEIDRQYTKAEMNKQTVLASAFSGGLH